MIHYLSKCCNSKPNTTIVYSNHDTAQHPHLITTKEGFLWGVCGKCSQSSHFHKHLGDGYLIYRK